MLELLPEVVKLAIGQRVMVTYNVQMEVDIANGAHSEVVDIIFKEGHPLTVTHEKGTPTINTRVLYVLVKLD